MDPDLISLNDLPNELILYLIQYLAIDTFWAFASTCTRLRNLTLSFKNPYIQLHDLQDLFTGMSYDNLDIIISVRWPIPQPYLAQNYRFVLSSKIIKYGRFDLLKSLHHYYKINPRALLDVAVKLDQLPILKFLLRKSADPSWTNLIVVAIENNQVRMFQYLMNRVNQLKIAIEWYRMATWINNMPNSLMLHALKAEVPMTIYKDFVRTIQLNVQMSMREAHCF